VVTLYLCISQKSLNLGAMASQYTLPESRIVSWTPWSFAAITASRSEQSPGTQAPGERSSVRMKSSVNASWDGAPSQEEHHEQGCHRDALQCLHVSFLLPSLPEGLAWPLGSCSGKCVCPRPVLRFA
jgi:hypothetical protein